MPLSANHPRAAQAAFCAALIFLLPGAGMAAIDAPVTPNARPGVASLLRVLDGISGSCILSGQQETGWDPNRVDEDVEFVRQQTGKYPVVRGFDFADYLYSASAPARLHATERAIAWARRGGVVTFSCHMFVSIGSPPGSPQFYAPSASREGTTFDIRRAVIDGTPENAELLAKMDTVAAELGKLQDAGVVVIWRPFHECSGGWFWWGTHGPEPYKKAWRIMFERFTVKHRLANLIWCYNPTDSAGNMEAWYPGDDVVDMIGLDFYPRTWTFFGLLPGIHPTFADDFRRLRAFRNGRKVIAMSENGAIPDPARLFSDGAGWAYFMTWNGFENDPSQNSPAFLRAAYHHPKVITLDDFPSIYSAYSKN
jgi:mannan endo-1,4-beta-mannosidase